VKVDTGLELRNAGLDSSQTPGWKRKLALVVEDDPTLCALIQQVLEAHGIEAIISSQSIDTEDHSRDKKVDMFIIGFCGPPAGALELVRQIRKSGFNRGTPVVLLSSDQRPAALLQGFEAGANFFVYKPIDRAHLMRLMSITQGTMEHERRRFRRVPVQAKVQVKSNDAALLGETLDISLNGMLVRVPHTLPIGSRVEVSLLLAEPHQPIVGPGPIVRVLSDTQMGILLDRLSIPDLGRLEEFLLPLLTKQNSPLKATGRR
jgi:DNA-binding response OmpR family regulator